MSRMNRIPGDVDLCAEVHGTSYAPQPRINAGYRPGPQQLGLVTGTRAEEKSLCS